ncbi:MAG: hypothetical protein U9R14_02960 [Patescibacteria group bacterium]|nr:hypothetical protein [Patescibacteria group bacterium]
MAIPKFLQSALWSYNLENMDINNKADKRIIIEQILNFGTWKQLKWLINNCSWREIKQIIKNPSPGLWMEDSLNYWLIFFGIKLSNAKKEKAIFNLWPKST